MIHNKNKNPMLFVKIVFVLNKKSTCIFICISYYLQKRQII